MNIAIAPEKQARCCDFHRRSFPSQIGGKACRFFISRKDANIAKKRIIETRKP